MEKNVYTLGKRGGGGGGLGWKTNDLNCVQMVFAHDVMCATRARLEYTNT